MNDAYDSHDLSDLDWALVGRYLGGELSPTERLAFERWIDALPSRRDEMVLIRRLWDDARTIPSPAAVDGMWRSMSRKMRLREAGVTSQFAAAAHPRTPSQQVALPAFESGSSRWKAPAMIAAAAVLIVGVALDERHRGQREAASPPPPVKEFRTGAGQRATIQLSDGSRVELGVASVLTVAPFTDSSRYVTLEGEALFDVVHDERRPFRVHSAGTITEDLGTRFGIRAYREDPGVRVVVSSGVVTVHSVASQASPSVLRAGQLARLSPGGAVTIETNVDTSRYLAWTSGRLVLRNEPLRNAVVEIGRWHDVKITIPDEQVARLKITADMQLGSLEETLNAVTIPLELRYSLSEQGAIIVR